MFYINNHIKSHASYYSHICPINQIVPIGPYERLYANINAIEIFQKRLYTNTNVFKYFKNDYMWIYTYRLYSDIYVLLLKMNIFLFDTFRSKRLYSNIFVSEYIRIYTLKKISG
jgi:hypothetical protein